MKPPKNKYRFAAKSEMQSVLKNVSSSLNGLDIQEVAEARKKFGTNAVTPQKRETFLNKLIRAFINPFTLILIGLAIVSFITEFMMEEPGEGDLTKVIIISLMVVISGLMTLIQSVKSSNAVGKLLSLIRVTATVTRQNAPKIEVPIDEIVVGDIVHLSAGDMIPADIRLLQTKDLFTSQAAMTGESNPIEKTSHVVIEKDNEELATTDFPNLVFMGSNVVSGSAFGVVIGVGDDTLFGNIAQDINHLKPETNFEKGVNSVSWVLIRFMLIMVPVIFLLQGIFNRDWMEALMAGVGVAVGLTPEMLPTVVTTGLVKGATAMAKKGTVIKNLNSIQNFGAIDVLCTDKTGTLTQDKIVLQFHLNVDGNPDERVLRHAFFNSFYQTGLRNLMDKAIIEAAREQLNLSTENYKKVDEIPFDFERRRMSVVIEDQKGKTQLITKGAIEEMLQVASYMEKNGEVCEITEAERKEILSKVAELNSNGMRVIGVAQKTNPRTVEEFSVKDESEMVLIGYLAFLDPPKETTIAALEALQKHHVTVKILTGDNALVTKAVCEQVGLQNEKIILGHDIEKMNEAQLGDLVQKYHIFAKLSPQQKTKIVKALRDRGLTVGFMGDGINDAPAMKEADVGISVDNAVDIAKESADVILLEKDLLVLEEGIIAGRATFGNIMKYTQMTASSNFGNVFSGIVAAVCIPFIPAYPLQQLFLNLVYDTSCISMPWDNVDKEYLEHPRNWNSARTGSFMRWFGPTSSVFDISTYFFLFYVICPQMMKGTFYNLTETDQETFKLIFQTGMFVLSLWTQTLVLHVLRTPKIPFVESRASGIVIALTGLGIAFGTIVPFTPFGAYFGMQALPPLYFVILFVSLICYIALTTVVKKFYIKRFGSLY